LTDKAIEEWKSIDGYDNVYKVSSLGKVKRVTPKEVFLNGGWYPNGYKFVCLSKNKQTASKMIHRLVAKAFIENKENKPQVNHKDGNKQNNVASNLEWVTCSENLKHAVDIGLVENQCKIRRRSTVVHRDGTYEEYASLKDLAANYGYTKGWAHNRIRKFGNVFYERDDMIVIYDRDCTCFTIPTYVENENRKLTHKELASLNGINYFTLEDRLHRGWSMADAISKPVKVHKKRGDAQ